MVEFRKWQKRYAQEKIAVRRIQRWWRNLPRRGETGPQEKTSDGEGEGGRGGVEGWMREEEGEGESLNLPQQDV